MLVVPPSVAVSAVARLAEVDYTVANRVSEDVARTVAWAFAHHQPWLACAAVSALQTFDDLGSLLIGIVVWLVYHTPG